MNVGVTGESYKNHYGHWCLAVNNKAYGLRRQVFLTLLMNLMRRVFFWEEREVTLDLFENWYFRCRFGYIPLFDQDLLELHRLIKLRVTRWMRKGTQPRIVVHEPKGNVMWLHQYLGNQLRMKEFTCRWCRAGTVSDFHPSDLWWMFDSAQSAFLARLGQYLIQARSIV